MSNFEISRLTFDDLEEVIVTGKRAFAEDEMNRAVFPTSCTDPVAAQEEKQFRLERYHKNFKLDTHHFFKVRDVDAGGRLVGGSGWFGPGGKQWKEDPVPEGEDPKKGPPFKSMDPQFWKFSTKTMKEGRAKILKGDTNIWYLGSLYVDPDYKGRGIAKKLLQWGMDQADKDGVPCFLEATPAGQPLYEKMGFEVMDVTLFPDIFQDGKQYSICFMLRQPKSTAS